MAPLQKSSVARLVLIAAGLSLLTACGGSSPANPSVPAAPLSASNLNLIFVASEDLAYNDAGDVNPRTGNLTSRGLQRSLRLASFLQQSVLGGQNVSAIYSLIPTTHPQTANRYPDMAGLLAMQQFAMLNQISLSYQADGPLAAHSYPINVSYSPARLPDGVATPLLNCPWLEPGGAYSCQGLDFRDLDGDNEALVQAVLQQGAPGFYVFSAPWHTISRLMMNINQIRRYGVTVPSQYAGPNAIYALAIAPMGAASLVTYDSAVDPPPAYPTLPPGGIVEAACLPETSKSTFHVTVTGGVNGAVVPAGINTNETVYFVRHAEAHPAQWWEDGNYVGAGQWRALAIPQALRGKIHPGVVYSIDPAQATPGSESAVGDYYSYVRTDLTVLPYAIANSLPYKLATSFELAAQNPPAPATEAANFFFYGGELSGKAALVGWEHDHIPPTVNALLAAYHGGASVPLWPDDDYDTVWTVKLDAGGNVSVDNLTCEGISSPSLPATPPQF
jgi:hypothetical protein